ncbi:GNAT family N-acetyltransferase [Polaromonas sp. CG_23.6]|uniref:GNAT family N-acetyltransferase n=1 Tax=unclassified Polaromonas TaxID=2638319 RepID=UPI0018CA174B|nr:GNAT family N-acetyltransferase [Polaromonas sp. CG_23.6]MBG6072150.1 putative N-acyltransferase [Polaromonas sp. CG_9.7]MBG6114154.1 putative N-acyltransferase [Polaromonas sp. CG_9.2]MDH6184761.1 putative N-acyltransferase [Polaromonas sp. CG_23.6]
MKKNSNDYVIRILDSPLAVNAGEWNGLLAAQSPAGILNPFMRHEYLAALHTSGSATPKTGWTPRFVTLWQGDTLVGACALYLKAHSYGEYVFDWAWANAYAQNGLDYYPKALIAVPFTPVPGARLLARDAAERALLVKALVAWCDEEKLSSMHVLFADEDDVKACEDAGLMLRHTVQFHWTAPPTGYRDFDDFLMTLSQEKRKKIRQERRKVRDAGITFRWSLGAQISSADWDFFYLCYERTYLEHGNAPYLSRDFFHCMERSMPENWLLFVAEHDGAAIATSLIAVNYCPDCASGTFDAKNLTSAKDSMENPLFQGLTAYGRYWGALARVDCLHFEACYYQPIEWCIAHGFQSFEGGAQGEHKMARALLPVKTTSAHWLAHPSFADAVERFLEREGAGIDHYLEDLERRSPFKAHAPQPPSDSRMPS